MTNALSHRPVLLSEVLEALQVRPDGAYVDGTFGRGGHAAAMLDQLGPDGVLLALDKDPAAVAAARERFGRDPRFHIEHTPFATLAEVVDAHGLRGRVQGILLDLGVSSPQLDDPGRGFSFLREGPLDMRMDPTSGQPASEWLNQAAAEDIARVLFEYGEERFSRRIARAIVATRTETPLTGTTQLAALVAEAVPTREKGQHPATRTFQAIRIFVNRELEELQDVLAQCVDVLAAGGRLAVISFHSLEDRIVKRFMRQESRPPALPRHLPAPEFTPRLRVLGRPLRPSAQECVDNPRARSAVLRVAERVA